MRESDLYPPLKDYLTGQGYQVKSEVERCDVVALRDDESPVVVELKASLNLIVLLQAVDRLKLSDTVYVGIPAGLAVLESRREQIVKLLRMLGLGLLVIDPGSRVRQVTVVCDPGEYRPRRIARLKQRLLGEFERRVGDPNLGGSSTKRGIMTAYRQRALAIAAYLRQHGETKASVIAGALGEPRARAVLYDDVYGWFDRVGRGVYALSPRGETEPAGWESHIE